jgi:hypothetical protein
MGCALRVSRWCVRSYGPTQFFNIVYASDFQGEDRPVPSPTTPPPPTTPVPLNISTLVAEVSIHKYQLGLLVWFHCNQSCFEISFYHYWANTFGSH